MSEITLEELQLAARNHGMPLEALREPITPVGLHYLLIHYDIPHVDPASWRLTVDGAVDHELSLDLGALRARPATELASTMECAGNGRARLEPRPISQPWLLDAVGTGRWRGPSLAGLLQEARPAASRAGGALHRSRPRAREGRGAVVPAQPAARRELVVDRSVDGQPPRRRVHVRDVVVDQQVVEADRRDRLAERFERHPVVPRCELQLLERDLAHRFELNQ